MLMKTVGVKFLQGGSYQKTYYYLTDDMSIDVDDYCLVIDGAGIPAVVKVNDANAIDQDKKATKVIMSKINTKEFFDKQKLLAEREAKMARLEQISKEAFKAEKYKILENHSDEAKQLLIDLGIIKVEETK